MVGEPRYGRPRPCLLTEHHPRLYSLAVAVLGGELAVPCTCNPL
jgi:hypothetical protein